MALVDFAIVTGLVEEFKVVTSIIPEFQLVANSDHEWYRTRVKSSSSDRTYTVIASHQTAKGPLDAHALSVRMIQRWDPAHIVLLGIAGSFDRDVRLGDVVAGQQVFYYDPGKAQAGGIRYRPQGYPCGVVLIRQAEALFIDDKSFTAWQSEAKASAANKAMQGSEAARAELLAHEPQVHFGTVASGSLVVADKAKQEDLLKLHGQILATEMEGAGVMHAAFDQELPTSAIIIKGISDAADANKGREDAKVYWRDLAKENSVRFFLHMLRRGRFKALRTDELTLDATIGAAAEARTVITDSSAPGVSYLAFPRLIAPQGPLTDLEVRMDATNESDPLICFRLVMQYTDLQGKRRREEAEGNVARLSAAAQAQPIGVYALIDGTASRVKFSVTTPSGVHETTWTR